MDRNNFKKMATIYTAIFFVVIFLIGMVFFRKDDNNAEENNLKLNSQPLVEDIKEERITEEEKIKSFAENFAMIYYSYTWGNFSNIESQYYYMTDEMKDRERNKVEQIKKAAENQPQKYFTARANFIDSEFLYYEKAKANLKINLSVDNYAGAIVQRDTMVWVDKNGNYCGGDIRDLIASTIKKKINIELVKIGEEWKADEIEEIEK
jgi:alpha-galactosidase/6-phospho-beta-glucosidase family protein